MAGPDGSTGERDVKQWLANELADGEGNPGGGTPDGEAQRHIAVLLADKTVLAGVRNFARQRAEGSIDYSG